MVARTELEARPQGEMRATKKPSWRVERVVQCNTHFTQVHRERENTQQMPLVEIMEVLGKIGLKEVHLKRIETKEGSKYHDTLNLLQALVNFYHTYLLFL